MLEGYIASSADGFVADAEGGVSFLDPYNDGDYGYDAFLDRMDGIVMGRATYDQIIGWGIDWPYARKECFVVTSSDLAHPPETVRRWTGSLCSFAAHTGVRAFWVLGGARLQAGFIASGLLDRLQLFLMPVLLGRGTPLFSHQGAPVGMALAGQRAYDNGVVALDYRFAAEAA